jgi:hypothetical protein
MFDRDKVVAANSATTASENFDGETVIIHFERGTYFSLRGSAVTIWSLLQSPTSIAAIIEAVCDQQAPVPDNLEPKLTEFFTQLAKHDLLTDNLETAARPDLSPDVLLSLTEPAGLEVYSDLAELIAMDPVHEVDVLTGWPHGPRTESHGS